MSASLDNAHFVLRRLHSHLGLVPVGAFLVFHLWKNSQSRFGAAHYNSEVFGALQRMSYLPALEILAIALPLLFYAGYGIVILHQGRAEPRRYPFCTTGSTGSSGSRGWGFSRFCCCMWA
jgi:succinate dehydrogenase / fumarate reductase, cytochrome b subunit